MSSNNEQNDNISIDCLQAKISLVITPSCEVLGVLGVLMFTTDANMVETSPFAT